MRGVVPRPLFSRLIFLLCLVPGSGSLADEVLEEIQVTATKRLEDVQDIPMSVSVVSGNRISRELLLRMHDLSSRVANFSVGGGLITDSITIRGIGSGNERSFEQAVGMFIDDIYMPRSKLYRTPFLDAERVEIARGPQSVLFGLNATAGAVAVHSARSRPGDPFFVDLWAEYEAEYGGTSLTAITGGSPTDSLGLRLAARTLDSGDGYWQNLVGGQGEGVLSNDLVRGSLVWDATNKVSVDAKLEYSRFDNDGSVGELYTTVGAYSDGSDKLDWVRGQDAALLPLFPKPRVPESSGEAFTISTKADIDIGESVFTAVIGYSDFEWSVYDDLDSGSAPIIDSGVVETYEQSSLELRWASPTGGRFDYVLGAYLHSGDLANQQPNLVEGEPFVDTFGFPVAGFDAGRLWSNSQFEQDEDVYSAFGLLSWNVNDQWRIRAGARYTRSEKRHTRSVECLVRRSDGSYANPDPAGNPNDALLLLIGFCPSVIDPPMQSRESNNLMPEVSLQWTPSEEVMLYGRVNSSAKSGGFVGSTIVVPGRFEYDDESALGFDVGIKTALREQGITADLTIFHTEYDDLQVNSFDPETAASIISNAGSAVVKGAELDVRWAVADWLTAGGSVGYLDTEFESFPVGPCYPGEPVNPDGVGCDKSGQSLAFSPRLNGNVYIDIDSRLTDSLRLLGGVNVSFSEDYLTEESLDPLAEQGSWTRLDVRLGIGSADSRWAVSIMGKNVTDEVVNSTTQPFLGVYRGYIQMPRTVWLQGRLRLGSL